VCIIPREVPEMDESHIVQRRVPPGVGHGRIGAVSEKIPHNMDVPLPLLILQSYEHRCLACHDEEKPLVAAKKKNLLFFPHLLETVARSPSAEGELVSNPASPTRNRQVTCYPPVAAQWSAFQPLKPVAFRRFTLVAISCRSWETSCA
jgi:hypothetical protein